MTNSPVQTLLNRGVVEINVKQNLQKRIENGEKLRVKFGIDPTGSDLHLGHTVPLRKLKAFQDSGHQVVLLFGTFTGKIGDPTGKDKLRKPLSNAEIEKNMETYLEQAGKILDIENIEVVKNGDWLAPMTFEEILKLAGSFTASQMMQRDMFQKRLEKGMDINLVEFFYPLMQGYDSVPIKADVEIGGTDQLFNLMAGRKIQESFEMKPQDILTVPILEGLDGQEKMSKSLNNYIAVNDIPREIFGKIMSIPDSLMPKYFELLTDREKSDYETLIAQNPKEAKMQLGEDICTYLHSPEEAKNAREEFITMFSERKNLIPEDTPNIEIASKEYSFIDLCEISGIFASKSEARRKMNEGAVKLNGEKKENPDEIITINSEEIVLQMGKRKFCKISGK